MPHLVLMKNGRIEGKSSSVFYNVCYNPVLLVKLVRQELYQDTFVGVEFRVKLLLFTLPRAAGLVSATALPFISISG